MNWQALGTIAEIIGALVVVVTVMYLAIQTRQHTLAVQASVRQAMLSEDCELLFRQMDYPFTALQTYGRRELSDEELVQLTSWLMAFMRTRENYWLQYRSGNIDGATWDTFRVPLHHVLSSQMGRSLWNNLAAQGMFNAGFVNDINRNFGEAAAPDIPTARALLGLDEDGG
jgi:hypothetical protein